MIFHMFLARLLDFPDLPPTPIQSSMKKQLLPLLAILALLFLVSCTAGPNALTDTPAADGKSAGFLMGLWHGVIAPVTFFLSLFMDNISLYEVHNNGGWYDFGFVLGAGIIFGGGSKGSASMRKYSRKNH